MKNNFNRIKQPQLVQKGTPQIKQLFNQRSFVFKSELIADQITIHDSPIAGYGACRSCDCRGYKKSKGDNYCSNCGHHYDQHK